MKICQVISYFAICLLLSCQTNAQKKETFEIVKTDQEWRIQLNDIQYKVLRQSGTERAFSSTLNKIYKPGIYSCAACNTPLFEGKYKFDSVDCF